MRALYVMLTGAALFAARGADAQTPEYDEPRDPAQEAEEAGEAVEETGEAAGEAAEETGEAAGAAAEETGEAAGEAAEESGGAIERGVDAVTDTGRAAVEEVTDEEPARFLGLRGLAVSAGIGVAGYTNNEANDFIEAGLSYGARMHVGTYEPLGFELAYIGSAHDVEALGLDNDAVLVSNGIEAAVRYNVARQATLQPYVLAGVALRDYSVTNSDRNTSSVNDGDGVLELPIGLGVNWRSGPGIMVDARLGYRFATGEDLLGGGGGGGPALDTWDATLRAGWEF